MSRIPRVAVGLARACHPEPTAAVTLGATLLAVLVGRSAAGTLLAGLTVLASQLCVGWTNDWLDAGRDALVGRPDKPIATGAVSRRTVGTAALIAGPAMVTLGVLSGPAAALAAIVGLISGLAYDWPLKGTVLSPLPYLISFGALAAFVVLGRAGAPLPPWWLVLAAALLGGGAHFANVLPDLADDARTGIVGLPHRLGYAGSWVATAALLLGATATLVFGPPGPPSLAGWGVGAAAAVVLPIGGYQAHRTGSRAAFRAVLVVALADVVLLMLSGRIVP